MKLWVDDERPAPEGWLWCKTSYAAVSWLSFTKSIEEISLDHDLGGDDTTRKVVLWMVTNNVWPSIVRIHTANPVGRDWLVGMIERYGPGVSK